MRRRNAQVGVLAALWVLMLPTAERVAADSWLPPMTAHYDSPDGTYRFTVIPRKLGSTLGYFLDLKNDTPLPGQDPTGPFFCRGILATKDADGGYRVVWETALSNTVSPVHALVAPEGRYVVTFDNWHHVGYGDNVVIIYGPGGRMIREFGLADLMSEEMVRMLPRSVSSIWWGGDHHIEDGETLVLSIVANGKMSYEEDIEYWHLPIALATGQIM